MFSPIEPKCKLWNIRLLLRGDPRLIVSGWVSNRFLEASDKDSPRPCVCSVFAKHLPWNLIAEARRFIETAPAAAYLPCLSSSEVICFIRYLCLFCRNSSTTRENDFMGEAKPSHLVIRSLETDIALIILAWILPSATQATLVCDIISLYCVSYQQQT